MGEVIIAAVFGTLVLLFRQFFVWISDESKYEKYDVEGTLVRTSSTSKGATRFYVRFKTVDGIEMEGKSIGYKCTRGKYRIGDKMKIQYMINKNGVACVEVLDDSLKDSKAVIKVAIKVMTVIMIFFYVLAVWYLIEYLS